MKKRKLRKQIENLKSETSWLNMRCTMLVLAVNRLSSEMEALKKQHETDPAQKAGLVCP